MYFFKLFSIVTVTWLFGLSIPEPLLSITLDTVASDVQDETIANAKAEAQQLSQEGRDQLQRSELLEAAHTFEQALELYRELGDSGQDSAISAKEIEILTNLTGIYTSVRDYGKTLEYSQATLALAQELGDRDTQLKQLIALGEAYYSSGDYQQALESAQAGLVLAQELQNDQATAEVLLTLASTYQSIATTKTDYQKASKAAISSLTTAWKVKDHTIEAKALAILGSIHNALRENQTARVFAKQGWRVAQENDVQTAALSSLLTLAGIYLDFGEYSQVIEYTKQSQDYLENLEEREAESATLVIQGVAYFAQGNTQNSQELSQQSLSIAREVESPLIEALALIVLSLNSSDSHNFQQALELIKQSQGIAQAQNNPDLEALALEVQGGIYHKSKQRESAIASYQEAISINPTSSALAGLARIYQESGLLSTAIAYYKQAINKNEAQNPLQIPGLPIWLQESFPKAVQQLNIGPTVGIYRSLANILLLEKRVIEAQEVLELLKGQELREYTGNSTVSSQPASLLITPIEEEIIREYGSLITFGRRLDECQQNDCSELESLLSQRESLIENYYQVLAQLETKIGKIRATDEAFVDPNLLLQKAQTIVEAQPGTVLIYPLVLEDRIWLIWASKGGIIKSLEVTGVSQSQLEVTVLRFRQLLQNRLSNIDEVQATGKQLYDWLLKPLEPELKANNIHHLVFSLDRSTRYIPMSALFDGEKYLVENYTVATVLSANLTNMPLPRNTQIQRQQPPRETPINEAVTNSSETEPLVEEHLPIVLALGLSEPVAGFRSLPQVPPELDAIVRLDDADPNGVYPGQKFLNHAFDFFALRDNLPTHRILHIATHSKFLPGRASQSYLLLGTGERFAIPDIETWLNLRNIDLVVLSACETALGGPGLNGKEIAGIGYYFLKGGAKTVIASLWNVNDLSTRLLMEQFYNRLAQDTPESPVATAQALRLAQLALLNGEEQQLEQQNDNRSSNTQKNPFRHPYYWAPFILMGSGL